MASRAQSRPSSSGPARVPTWSSVRTRSCGRWRKSMRARTRRRSLWKTSWRRGPRWWTWTASTSP